MKSSSNTASYRFAGSGQNPSQQGSTSGGGMDKKSAPSSVAPSSRFDVDQRSALFATFGPKKRADFDKDKFSAYSSAAMEAENDLHILDLEAKVHGLKDISLKLRQETLESNTILGKMSLQFDNVGGVLAGTMSSIKALSSSASGRHIWLMMLFVVCVFFVMYVLFGRSKR